MSALLAWGGAEGEESAEIRVGLGPGAYAGVRAALAAATGLVLARPGARIVGLPSVCAYATDALAWHAVGDARRGAWYHTAVEGGRCLEGPEICTLEQLQARLAARPEWPVLTAEEISALPAARRAPADAARLLALVLEATPRALEPIYLREPYITLPRPRAL